MDGYRNAAMARLIDAATTQLELALTIESMTAEPCHQSRISRWLNDENAIPTPMIPILIAVGESLGVVLTPADLRPDLAAMFASD